MEGESRTQASTPAGAVFLSYASQDAEAAKRICEALRAAGMRSGSTRASFGAETPGTSRSASRSRPARLSSQSSPRTLTCGLRGISGSSGSWRSIALRDTRPPGRTLITIGLLQRSSGVGSQTPRRTGESKKIGALGLTRRSVVLRGTADEWSQRREAVARHVTERARLRGLRLGWVANSASKRVAACILGETRSHIRGAIIAVQASL